MAKILLDRYGVAYEEIDVTRDREREQEMVRRSGRRTVPQVFIAGEPVGGFMDLAALAARHDLKKLLGEDE